MYTFKVLNNNELVDSRNITCNGDVKSYKDLRSFFSKTKGNLKKGDSNNSCWINTSSDFMCDVEKCNMPNLKKGDVTRSNMAVIDGYSKNEILVSKGIISSYDGNVLDVPISSIRKMVLDYSTRASIKQLKDKGFIIKEDGTVCTNNFGIYSYSKNDKDIYVFKEISEHSIIGILDSLDIDLIYSLIASNEYGNQDDAVGFYFYCLRDCVSRNIDDYDLTFEEKLLMKEMYINNKHLTSIAIEILKENLINCDFVTPDDFDKVDVIDLTKDGIIYNYYKGVDILNIFAYLKRKKRVILWKILKQYGVDLDEIVISEDVMQIVRIGDVYQNGIVRLFYKGEQLFIPQQAFKTIEDDWRYSDFANVSVALMKGNTEFSDQNMDRLDEAEYIARSFRENASEYINNQFNGNQVKTLKLEDFK